MDFFSLAQNILNQEISALQQLAAQLERQQLEQFIRILSDCQGVIVVCGVGKSGLIGQKIAATLSSTGSPSLFLQASEALHGDLGILRPQDVFLSISNSGETDEILQLIPFVRQLGIPHLSLVGNKNSTLAKNAHFYLDIGVSNEISPIRSVPMASCLTTLAVGDILATALIHHKNFRETDFARLHPGGSLGRKLLTQVADLMQISPLPICQAQDKVKDILFQISSSQLGMVVVFEQGQLRGVVTDGDLRRALSKHEDSHFFQLCAADLMNPNPKTIAASETVSNAEILLQTLKINALLVVDENKQLVGILAKHHIR